MKLDKEIVFSTILLITLISILLLLNNSNFQIKSLLNSQKSHNLSTITEYLNCKDSPIEEDVDRVSEIFNGIVYDRNVAVCLQKENVAYCLGGKRETYANLSIVYFETCAIQNGFDPSSYDEIVVINYSFYNNELKLIFNNETQVINALKNGSREGYVKNLSEGLFEAILGENIKDIINET